MLQGPDLAVRTVVTGLAAPTTIAFIGRNDILTGRNFGVGTDIETGPNGNAYVV